MKENSWVFGWTVVPFIEVIVSFTYPGDTKVEMSGRRLDIEV